MRIQTCACGRWQLRGIPCCHAVSCIHYNREKLEHYVHPSLKVEAALRTYSHMIHPLNDSSQWIRSEGPKIRLPTFAPHQGQNRRRGEWKQESASNKRKTSKDGTLGPCPDPAWSCDVLYAGKRATTNVNVRV
ncbi:hypothetical protein LINPERHAP2_LOCUS2908 [Linum perenne]